MRVMRGVRCGRLVTSHAFHSALMEPVLDGIEAAAGGIEVRSPEVSLVSNVTGRVVGEGELLDGAYWRRHARAPVAYGAGVGALSGVGVDVAIEIGPGAVLGPLLAQVWPGDEVPVVLASQRRGSVAGHGEAASGEGPGAGISAGEGDGFVEAVAGAWEAGLGLRFEGLHAGEVRRRLSLPTYPFERRRYWVEGLGRRRAVGGHALLGRASRPAGGGITFERELSVSDPRWLVEHRVVGRVMAPAALHAVLAAAARAEAGGSGAVVFEAFQIHAPLVFDDADESHPERGGRSLQVMLGEPEAHGARTVEVYSRGLGEEAWVRHAEGRVGAGSREDGGEAALDVEGLKGALVPVPAGSLYEAMGEVGIGYGPRFRVVRSAWTGAGEALVEVSSGAESGEGWSSVMVLDGCFQALAAVSGGGGSGGGDVAAVRLGAAVAGGGVAGAGAVPCSGRGGGEHIGRSHGGAGAVRHRRGRALGGCVGLW